MVLWAYSFQASWELQVFLLEDANQCRAAFSSWFVYSAWLLVWGWKPDHNLTPRAEQNSQSGRVCAVSNAKGSLGKAITLRLLENGKCMASATITCQGRQTKSRAMWEHGRPRLSSCLHNLERG